MELFGTIFGVGALALLFLMVGVFSRRGSERASEEMPVRTSHSLEGSVKKRLMKYRGMKVTIDYYQVNKADVTEIRLKYRIRGAGDFSICHEGAVSRLKKKIGIGDVTIGDPAFDERMLVQAAEPLKLLAFLDADARSAILSIDTHSIDFWFTSSELMVSFHQGDFSGDRRFDLVMEMVHRLLENFFRGKIILNQYVDMVRYDTVPGVRLAAIGALASLYPADSKAVALFRECLQDDNFNIVFAAASALGEEGMAHIAGMLSGEKDLTPEKRIKIIQAFGKYGYRKAIPVLIDIYNDDEAVEILGTFEKLGDDSCCEFLMKLLGISGSRLQPHIRDALAACGTAETVKQLRDRAKVVKRKVVRSVYDDIADRIVARLGNARDGWLSAPESAPMDGALSRHDTAGEGALSGEGKVRK
ncbi:MAG TPA: HEAT repeat domain-containing protein [Spirochaetota bacterium]|nr:HEAT repeat domain-containing protein [Spirochaetota bacterium]